MPFAFFEPTLTFAIIYWLLILAAPGLVFLLVAVAFALLGPMNNRTRRIVQCCAWFFVVLGSFSFLLISANLVFDPDERAVWLQFGVAVLLYIGAALLLVRCRRQKRREIETATPSGALLKRKGCSRRITAAILLTGLFCAPYGTLRTRIAARKSYEVFQGHNTQLEHSPGAFFGKPPYQAVTDDIVQMKSTQFLDWTQRGVCRTVRAWQASWSYRGGGSTSRTWGRFAACWTRIPNGIARA